MRQQDVVRRIWAADPFVWSGADEDRWLGWLNLPLEERSLLERLTRFAAGLQQEPITDLILLGMGGSSLAPEVIQSIIGRQPGHPTLHVLDSTDPGQILGVERAIDYRTTLFLVASKSGSTLEVNILKQYFFHRAVQKFGEAEAGRRFVLTTDPGSKLQQIAEQEHFRDIVPGLSKRRRPLLGAVQFRARPGAAIGVDISLLLDRAEAMARRCALDDADNSAFQLASCSVCWRRTGATSRR